MVARLLYLEPGQLRRAWPFFALYVVLFAALTLADGLSLALFVVRVGADALPRYQVLSALCVMFAIGWYLRSTGGRAGDATFLAILLGPALLFAAIWAGLHYHLLDDRCLGLLFLGRELAFALVLLHFGAYLQDYFTRAELNRVMPVIYAGGRVGGIAAGAALERLSPHIEPAQMLLPLVGLLAASMLGIVAIRRFASASCSEDGAAPIHLEESSAAPLSSGFLGFVWRSPLLFWITASTVALFFCRAGLALQYNQCFQRAFADEAAMAQFLGRYAQIALAASLLFQLLIVGRLVAWIGLRGAQVGYALLIVTAALGGWSTMPLAAAVFARFVETELRFGMRNPLAQMTVNRFPKHVRTKARAWSLGILIPLATIAASLGLDALLREGAVAWIVLATIVAGAAYLASTFGLGASTAAPHSRPLATRRPIALHPAMATAER